MFGADIPGVSVLLELRCPAGPRALLAKIVAAGGPVVVTADNLVELSCRDCKHRERDQGRECRLVLHRFDITGALVESEIIR